MLRSASIAVQDADSQSASEPARPWRLHKPGIYDGELPSAGAAAWEVRHSRLQRGCGDAASSTSPVRPLLRWSLQQPSRDRSRSTSPAGQCLRAPHELTTELTWPAHERRRWCLSTVLDVCIVNCRLTSVARPNLHLHTNKWHPWGKQTSIATSHAFSL